ncbi:sulfurtransferase complex subunit TusB [Halopseudomonas nanhaiensis]|uniref:sulfurtransferase complex subunit TusB n=1 Tax=Halopseudomonas nanhaiensis TaxID=2830842 RepID=UPI001CC18FC6|nr:sulfurtransferase complex subunit TusB [Halopseudomonas nanhaiensis]UAW96877.1 sulfurtransferase complex subunit TusB [Halopseudomonas nanhaiensis]
MLHLLRHAPHTDPSFASCLRAIAAGQNLLLLEDAVYALLPATNQSQALGFLPASIRIYAIESDLLGRGLALDAVPARVQLIDYPRFVELCVAHEKVISW